MSLYNTIFGVNPAAGVLLAIIGQSPRSVGRFRDVYVTTLDGDPVIAVYTRNGGGNRECSCAYDTKYGTEACKHRAYEVEVDETVTLDPEEGKAKGLRPGNVFYGSKRLFYTGKRVMQTRYECLEPDSPSCHCTGCTMIYHIPAMSGYLRDEDDEFDCTYNTAHFRVPEEWRDMLEGRVREGSPDTDWREFLDALQNPPSDPQSRPQKLAVNMIASMGDPDSRKKS